ncbi:rad25 (nucleomorph) [Hemiselmis andersenii]|uniref:DNA 3'-5' helicase n=2 Tax=Hemiselmis andersenii TaxID=464988 RepID=A9BKY7_HEMAN|nr:rad25 [Hemiselmis andersenii]ABW98142.1 rad25 [Hemiselmis andersenii]|mmetsp:Transcript_27736/g.67630  ORF Transcript_27736/g.67630 Transcript_27736/m.67630 type:complete len:639 (+) Transcript_27736:5287-7203(+)
MIINKKPLWVFPDGFIMFETFSNPIEEVEDFLITISEPVSRTKLIHEYVLTPYALYAAVTSGMNGSDVIKILRKLSKNLLPKTIFRMISICTQFFGKIHLVLFKNNYFIYAPNYEIIKTLLNDEKFKKFSLYIVIHPKKIINLFSKEFKFNYQEKFLDLKFLNEKIKLGFDQKNLFSKHLIFSTNPNICKIEDIKKRSMELDCPLLEEYDFLNDFFIPSIKIDLNPTTTIRRYQEKAISKMFNRGRARSGVIVLPCGAGKTIVGITSVTMIKKTALIVCNSTVSVEQWRRQFIKWSNINPKKIKSFIAGQYSNLENGTSDIIVTTYSMISFGGQRAKLSASLLNEIKSREWGIVILDEVHIVPANVFRKVLGIIRTHCKLGLTATLLREDRKVGDIGFLIGPKLYEANWLDLEQIGFLAMACCAEICCSMPPDFFEHYLCESNSTRQILCALNPNKARICDFLIRYHESRGDRILVFSDNVFALRSYATKMLKAFIYGATGSLERIRILKNFQKHEGQTLFISRIGDTSIDLPEANVILQISSHYGSRRQEAQRLGRILRPKSKSRKAFFYSLVTSNTEEMFYANKRQQFLVGQGYDFKTILNFSGINKIPNLIFETEKEKKLLLKQVLSNQKNLKIF